MYVKNEVLITRNLCDKDDGSDVRKCPQFLPVFFRGFCIVEQ